MPFTARLKIECQRLDARLRQTPYPPSRHGLAGFSTLGLPTSESGPHAPTGHSLDTCVPVQGAAKEAAAPSTQERRTGRHAIPLGPAGRAAQLLAERDHARDIAVALEQELARALITIDQKERP